MQMLRRIARDVHQGENIDLYVTLLAAIVVTILSLIGSPNASLTQSLVLAVLAFVTFALLGNRYKLERILEQTSFSAHKKVAKVFPPELSSDLEAAKDIWFTGIHPHTTLATYMAALEARLDRGAKLRVLLVDPNGSACSMAAMRFPFAVPTDQVRSRVLMTLNTLAELRKKVPDALEIRTIDYLLEYGALLLDPTTSRGVAYLRRYTFKTTQVAGAQKPKLVYRKGDSDWFDLIQNEIQMLWESGTPWECN